MKHIIRGILLFSVLFGLPLAYSETAKGVAGVTITVKQIPAKHVVTDGRGAFSFDGLPAGSYTLSFRAQKAKDTKTVSTTQAVVATSYSIKVEGGTRPITQKLTSDNLLAGVDLPVQVGAGAKLRGEVLAGALKKMVWIAPEVGSHFQGHWVEADSKEAAAHNTNRVKGEDFRDYMQKAPDPHQEGFNGNGLSKLSGVNSPGR
jgi:hypothetical protein